MKCMLLALVPLFLFGTELPAQQKNIALRKPATANSENSSYPAKNAVDGKITRQAKWLSANIRPPHILEIDLQKYCDINSIAIHTGIPDSEKTVEESNQAAGFWSAKNFKLQYWDDANWTDIPNTEVHENRLSDIIFKFAAPLNTFKLRFICDDGEPISITEIEVFGTETNRVGAGKTQSLVKKTERQTNQELIVAVSKEITAKSMKYVGYNQGYYMPGSNASGWIEYSGVNSLRVWTSLNSYVPVAAVQVDKNINTVDEFDKRKASLRLRPEQNEFIKWDMLIPIYASPEKQSSTNPMVLDYVLSELKRLKVDAILQINNTDFNESWSNKWQQWQRFYALAFYAAKTGDVGLFAMQNEPNHRASGPMKLDQWISAMQIVSDAVSSALQDVNKIYGKSLKARMAGPVTAGNNPEWWAAVAKNLRTDYHGKTVDENLLGVFSTHSYNSPAAGYEHRVEDIRKLLQENQPGDKPLPIVYTEIGRWMNAYLIDKEETMDSPSLFTEWAGIYTNNTRNNAYGMWAFKFSNTSSETYPAGVKSGHHLTWQGKRIVEDAYTNLIKNKQVKTNDEEPSMPAKNSVDGLKTDKSAWHSKNTNTPKWVEIDLGKTLTLGSAVVYTGSAAGEYTAPDRVKNFSLQYFSDNQWKDIPGFTEKGNKYAQVFRIFKQPVSTSRLRFYSSDSGMIKVREIKAFAVNDGPDLSQANYDVAGIQRAGEVVRLFAKGFKEERPLFKTTLSLADENLDAMTSYDSISGNYYMWLVNRGNYKNNLKVDLSGLNVMAGSLVSAEAVSPESYGEINKLSSLVASRKFDYVLGPQSVVLLTVSAVPFTKMVVRASALASVAAGENADKNLAGSKELNVSLDASVPKNNRVAYTYYDLSGLSTRHIGRAVFVVQGHAEPGAEVFRLHVYGIPGESWKSTSLTWNTAPQLHKKEALLTGVGQKAFVAGEIAFTSKPETHMLDVSDLLRKHGKDGISFVLIRETRQIGDDIDKGRKVVLSGSGSAIAPRLELYTK